MKNSRINSKGSCTHFSPKPHELHGKNKSFDRVKHIQEIAHKNQKILPSPPRRHKRKHSYRVHKHPYTTQTKILGVFFLYLMISSELIHIVNSHNSIPKDSKRPKHRHSRSSSNSFPHLSQYEKIPEFWYVKDRGALCEAGNTSSTSPRELCCSEERIEVIKNLTLSNLEKRSNLTYGQEEIRDFLNYIGEESVEDALEYVTSETMISKNIREYVVNFILNPEFGASFQANLLNHIKDPRLLRNILMETLNNQFSNYSITKFCLPLPDRIKIASKLQPLDRIAFADRFDLTLDTQYEFLHQAWREDLGISEMKYQNRQWEINVAAEHHATGMISFQSSYRIIKVLKQFTPELDKIIEGVQFAYYFDSDSSILVHSDLTNEEKAKQSADYLKSQIHLLSDKTALPFFAKTRDHGILLTISLVDVKESEKRFNLTWYETGNVFQPFTDGLIRNNKVQYPVARTLSHVPGNLLYGMNSDFLEKVIHLRFRGIYDIFKTNGSYAQYISNALETDEYHPNFIRVSWAKGQAGGSCATKPLLMFLRNQMNPSDYKSFIWNLREDILIKWQNENDPEMSRPLQDLMDRIGRQYMKRNMTMPVHITEIKGSIFPSEKTDSQHILVRQPTPFEDLSVIDTTTNATNTSQTDGFGDYYHSAMVKLSQIILKKLQMHQPQLHAYVARINPWSMIHGFTSMLQTKESPLSNSEKLKTAKELTTKDSHDYKDFLKAESLIHSFVNMEEPSILDREEMNEFLMSLSEKYTDREDNPSSAFTSLTLRETWTLASILKSVGGFHSRLPRYCVRRFGSTREILHKNVMFRIQQLRIDTYPFIHEKKYIKSAPGILKEIDEYQLRYNTP